MYCPNPECPDRAATGRPGEYRDDMTVCPVCGSGLTRGSWEDLAARPPAPAERDDGSGAGGAGVELVRTTDVAEADAVIAALGEARVPYWRRVVGPDGTLLGAGRAVAAPGAEHVVLVPGRFEREALAVVEELHETVRALAGDDEALDWGDEEAASEGGPEAVEGTGGGLLGRLVTLVLVALMLLGMAAVLKSVLGS